VLTIRRLSMGSGFKYLMDSIAVGDGKPDQTSNLTRYYAESGTPPGVFLGAGLAHLDGGNGVEHGSQVSEEQLQNMLGLIVDPVSGEALGAVPRRKAASAARRVDARVSRLPADFTDEERAAEVVRIEAEEQARQIKQAATVAGFDLTFSPSKSVSVAWALADQGTKAVIYECHRRAIDYTLAYAERNVFHSRSGKDGVVQEDVTGVVAAAFTHYDSRSGDPQLHDHVVVWNKAKSVSDGQWRTLDSRDHPASLRHRRPGPRTPRPHRRRHRHHRGASFLATRTSPLPASTPPRTTRWCAKRSNKQLPAHPTSLRSGKETTT